METRKMLIDDKICEVIDYYRDEKKILNKRAEDFVLAKTEQEHLNFLEGALTGLGRALQIVRETN